MGGRALTAETIERIREARYLDGMTCPQVAEMLGVGVTTVNAHAPGRPGRISNEPVRRVFVESGLPACLVAAEIGWTFSRRRSVVGDSSRLFRALGLRPDLNRGRPSLRRLIDAEVAGLIAEACGQPAWCVMPDEDVAA